MRMQKLTILAVRGSSLPGSYIGQRVTLQGKCIYESVQIQGAPKVFFLFLTFSAQGGPFLQLSLKLN